LRFNEQGEAECPESGQRYKLEQGRVERIH
jgi:hypothetical protein